VAILDWINKESGLIGSGNYQRRSHTPLTKIENKQEEATMNVLKKVPAIVWLLGTFAVLVTLGIVLS